jgi:hypothetical protein
MLPISPTNPRLIIQLLSWNYSQKIKHADNGKAVVGYVPNHKYKHTSCAIQCRCTFDQCCKFQEIDSLVQIWNRCQYCKRKRIKRILAYKTKVLRTMLYINSNLGPLGSQARLHKFLFCGVWQSWGERLKACIRKIYLGATVYHLWLQRNSLLHGKTPWTEKKMVSKIRWEVKTRVLAKFPPKLPL